METLGNVVFLTSKEQVWTEAKDKIRQVVGDKKFETLFTNLRLEKYQPNEFAILSVATDSLRYHLCETYIDTISSALNLERSKVIINKRSIFRAPGIKESYPPIEIDPKRANNRHKMLEREKQRKIQQGQIKPNQVTDTKSKRKVAPQPVYTVGYKPKPVPKIDIEVVCLEVEKFYGVTRSAIMKPSKSINDELARDMAIHLSIIKAKAKLEDLTKFFDCNKKQIASAQKRVSRRTGKLAGYNETINNLCKLISIRVFGNMKVAG